MNDMKFTTAGDYMADVEKKNLQIALDQEIKQYQETLENIEKKYKNKSVKINTVTKKRVKEIVKQSKGDSDAVKQKIEELFNLSSLD